MAKEKPLDLAVVQAWLAAWEEADLFQTLRFAIFRAWFETVIVWSLLPAGLAARRIAWCFVAGGV